MNVSNQSECSIVSWTFLQANLNLPVFKCLTILNYPSVTELIYSTEICNSIYANDLDGHLKRTSLLFLEIDACVG